MVALIDFTFLVVHLLIQAAIWLVIASAIVSWLVLFNVINVRNNAVRQALAFLDGVTRPMLWPLRRVIPPLGGMDITPVIFIVVLGAADSTLLPALAEWLITLVSPAPPGL